MCLSKQQLNTQIEHQIHVPSMWTIGVTDNPKKSRQEHGSPVIWHVWEAKSEKVARKVEKEWLDKHCKSGAKVGDHPNWVCLFI